MDAAAELKEHYPGLDSQQIVDCLMAGTTQLRNLLMVRAHDDVQREYGTDSLTDASLSRMQMKARYAKFEIETYSCIVIDDEVTQSGYVGDPGDWFLDWLFRLRLGAGYESAFQQRVEHFRSPNIEERRLKFVSKLQEAMPDSARAPLVLFRLFPRALRILPAVAFGDAVRAQRLRQEQKTLLPAIGDCHQCEGRVLENDEICHFCGNPVWEFNWLLSD
jgi:hypothetical protein